MPHSRITRTLAPVIPGISDSAGDLIFVSGQVGFEEDGTVRSDFVRAIELDLRRSRAGAGSGRRKYEDLVRVNVYIAAPDQEKLHIWRETRNAIVQPLEPSASTAIGNQALFNGASNEIVAIAAL